MAGITFGGLSSGLPPNLVDQLIDAERIPIKSLEGKKEKSQTKLDLVTDLTDKVTALQGTVGTLASTKGFNDMQLTSGDPNIIQGVVDPSVGATGSWNIEVVQLAQRASAVTNGFPDKDVTEIGTGYFKFDTPDGTREVYINGNNNTLQGAANAINAANVGVRASVLNDRKTPDEPFKLLISGDSVGDDNKIKYPTLYFLDGDQDLYFDEERPAKNGIVKVDGFEFQVNDNTVEDVIPGVTLDLKQAAEGRQVNVTVKENQEVVSGKVQEFVGALNAVLTFIQQQNRMDGNTDTTKTLGGDGLIRSVENRMRRLVQGMQVGVDSNIKRLAQIGITFNRSGTLDFDQDKFNTILSRNPQSIQNFFVGDGFNTGFVSSLKRDVNALLDQAFGPLAVRKKALQANIKRLDQSIENKEKQLAKKEVSLRRKFAKLEETMSKLKSQGGAVASIGAGLSNGPNFGGAG